MDENGIIAGRLGARATLRIRSLEPYSSELTAEQIGVIADIAEGYGSGKVHVTPRQTIEIPDVERSHLEEITGLLNDAGLFPGSSGRYLRNVIACSRWCLYNVHPISDLARELNQLHEERLLPGKTNISLSGCDFSCTRSRTSDIGVIARADIDLTGNECIKCTLCYREPLGCQVEAIEVIDKQVSIDGRRCIHCGFCTNVCRPGTIEVKSTSFDLFIGGRGGIEPLEARSLRNIPTEEQLIREIDAILTRYSEIADDGERLGDVIERLGLKALKG